MPIHYPDILGEISPRRSFSYGAKDAILYALGIGMGEDEAALSFVYERELQVVPTAATVLAGGIMPKLTAPDGAQPSTLDFPEVVHGAQKVLLHRPLKPDDVLFAETKVLSVLDKGPKGAVMTTETTWSDAEDEAVATLVNTIVARADGGFGGPKDGGEPVAPTPDRAPDCTIELTTRPDQALIYRLNGDRNPLHADPEIAAEAGFPRPILHGLCTFGMTCRAVLQVTGYDASRILSHEARFSAPVFPGETLRVDLWIGIHEILFKASIPERGVDVVRNGRTVLRAA